MDLLSCQTRSRCLECHHYVNGACELLAALEEALAPRPAAPSFTFVDARQPTFQTALYELSA